MSKAADGLYRDNNHWETPWWLVEAIAVRFGFDRFDLDPAARPKTTKAYRYYTEADNGLEWPWERRVFVNPPWGKFEAKCKPNCKKKICQRRGYHLQRDFPGIGAWADKMIAESINCDLIVGLLPSNNTDAHWFHRLAPKCTQLIFLRGRVPFEINGVPMRNNAVASSLFVLGGLPSGVQVVAGLPTVRFWSLADLRRETEVAEIRRTA